MALAVPMASAIATAAVFSGALWVQHTRGAWPFPAPPTVVVPPSGPPTSPGVDTASTHGRIPVNVPAATTQELGIELQTVRRESLTQSVRAVATIVPDEATLSHVHTRVSGWVEQLDINTTGATVVAGQPLARIFSQELLSSQTEYLAVRRNMAASGIASVVLASGRIRLTVLGMTPQEIDAIEQTGEPSRLVTVVAPRSGVVVNRGVTVGTSVDPATTLFTIADLSRVWVLAEVPEANIPSIRIGTAAQVEFPASGREPFPARVAFVYPTLTDRTRTLRVRFSATNPTGALRPGLYGTAAFQSSGQAVLTVPRDAVVDTGEQQHVFVAVGDRFGVRFVSLGIQLADRVEIRRGLEEGEQVVASGVFLLDSESRLRATGGMGGHDMGAMEKPEGASPPAKPLGTPAAPHTGHRE